MTVALIPSSQARHPRLCQPVRKGPSDAFTLILPPAYRGEVPAGYIPLRPKTYGSYMLIRSILASRSEADTRAGDALVKQIGFPR